MGSNLLYKASIITTPTAYGVGVLNSIKPAFSVSDTELVTNGNFSNGTTGWTPNTNATLSIDDGRLKVAISGAGSGYPSQNITTEVGKKYIITANAYIGTATKVSLYSPAIGFNDLTADGSYNLTFTATSTSTQIRLYVYGDGSYGFWDNVSVKKVTDADFDFTRTSSATRVNPDYLIETVSINSANLVQNGNFSELSSQLITNGNFETDSDWTKGAGWSISNGKASKTGSASDSLYQSGTFLQNKTYKLSFSLTNTTQGNLIGQLFGGGGSNEFFNTTSIANGNYTFYVQASINRTTFGFYASGSFDGSIDNVSVKQVDPNDNWTLSSDSSIFQGFANIVSSGTYQYILQSAILTIGKKYKIQYTILSGSTGDLKLGTSFGVAPITSTVGTHSIIATALTTDLYIERETVCDVNITDISVIEIQENGVPRLDYTNGTASILLEPQSTNELYYSNDFSNSNWQKLSGASVSADRVLSPEGINNAWQINFDGTSNARIEQARTGMTNGADYTVSVYARVTSGTQQIEFGSITTASYILNTEWQRITRTEAENDTTSYSRIVCASANTIELYAFQLEKLSFATSYIPTTSGSTVTRAAETLNNAGNSDLINSTEGVLYAEIKGFENDAVSRPISISDGTTSNRINLFFPSSQTQVVGRVSSGGVTVADMIYTGINQSLFNKIAIKYKANDFALWINGVEVLTDSSGAAPTGLKELSFNNASTTKFYGKCKTVAVFKEALSDSELACLTSTNNREIFLNYYYRMQYVGANTEALSCAEQTFNI